MNWFNTNFIHNILNFAIGVQAALMAGLLATGCTADAIGNIVCSGSWINAKVTAVLILVSAGLKIVINIFRDGITGLFKPQPPVQK